MVPTVRQATKVHMAVLLAILAVLRAGDYWLARFDLTNETRGVVQGNLRGCERNAGVDVAHTDRALTAVLFLVTIRTDRWRFLIASALWLVVSIGGGSVYPSRFSHLSFVRISRARTSIHRS